MKAELIHDLFVKFENIKQVEDGVECWSARELQTILGYVQWRNYDKVIDKAKDACIHSDIEVSNHFVDVSKMIIKKINSNDIT